MIVYKESFKWEMVFQQNLALPHIESCKQSEVCLFSTFCGSWLKVFSMHKDHLCFICSIRFYVSLTTGVLYSICWPFNQPPHQSHPAWDGPEINFISPEYSMVTHAGNIYARICLTSMIGGELVYSTGLLQFIFPQYYCTKSTKTVSVSTVSGRGN